jgi:hypothetical protein
MLLKFGLVISGYATEQKGIHFILMIQHDGYEVT